MSDAKEKLADVLHRHGLHAKPKEGRPSLDWFAEAFGELTVRLNFHKDSAAAREVESVLRQMYPGQITMNIGQLADQFILGLAADQIAEVDIAETERRDEPPGGQNPHADEREPMGALAPVSGGDVGN